MGIGLLAAAVFSSSKTPADMPFIGAEVVRVAFRIGRYVHQVSETVEQRSDMGPQAWGRAYFDIDESLALAELVSLNDRKVRVWGP